METRSKHSEAKNCLSSKNVKSIVRLPPCLPTWGAYFYRQFSLPEVENIITTSIVCF